jgi:hypothetical protein
MISIIHLWGSLPSKVQFIICISIFIVIGDGVCNWFEDSDFAVTLLVTMIQIIYRLQVTTC